MLMDCVVFEIQLKISLCQEDNSEETFITPLRK